MADPNPFIIKIPEGATEIDLGPILRPLIFAIKTDELLHPSKIEQYWLDGAEALNYRGLLELITRPMISDYLMNNGWVDEDQDSERGPRGYTFIRDYQLKQPSWDRHGPWIRMSSPDSFTLRTAHDIIRQMAYPMHKTHLALAKAVIANSNILDRIVHELE